jgi:hypothetical protein
MFKPKLSFTTRLGAFFFWKSDDLIVVMKGTNSPGAKGVTNFELQTLNPPVDTMDTGPKLRGHQ